MTTSKKTFVDTLLEAVNESIDKSYDKINLDKTVEERYHSGVYQTVPTQKSEDKEELVKLFRELEDTLDTEKYYLDFKQNFIKIGMNSTSFDLEEEVDIQSKITPYMESLIEFMAKEVELYPLPEVKLIEGTNNNNNNILSPTAHYNPTTREIIIFTRDRHPKDILRSLAHELIHHSQNIEERLENITGTNIAEDDNLLTLEEEAYLKGNILFRKWEDSQKNSNVEQ